MNDITTVDKFALYIGGFLVVFGIVGIGLLEVLAGSPHPVTGEGQVVHEALVPITLRSYIILLGFLFWGGAALFRALIRPTTPEEVGAVAPTDE